MLREAMLEMLHELEAKRAKLEHDFADIDGILRYEGIEEHGLCTAFQKARELLMTGELAAAKMLVERFVHQVALYTDRIQIAFNFGFPTGHVQDKKSTAESGANAQSRGRNEKNNRSKSWFSCRREDQIYYFRLRSIHEENDGKFITVFKGAWSSTLTEAPSKPTSPATAVTAYIKVDVSGSNDGIYRNTGFEV